MRKHLYGRSRPRTRGWQGWILGGGGCSSSLSYVDWANTRPLTHLNEGGGGEQVPPSLTREKRGGNFFPLSLSREEETPSSSSEREGTTDRKKYLKKVGRAGNNIHDRPRNDRPTDRPKKVSQKSHRVGNNILGEQGTEETKMANVIAGNMALLLLTVFVIAPLALIAIVIGVKKGLDLLF